MIFDVIELKDNVVIRGGAKFQPLNPLWYMMSPHIQGSLGDKNGYIIITGGCDDPLGNQQDPDVSMK